MKEINEMSEIELRVLKRDLDSKLEKFNASSIPPEVMKELRDEWREIREMRRICSANVSVTLQVCYDLVLTNDGNSILDTSFDVYTPFEDEGGQNEDEIYAAFPELLEKRAEIEMAGRVFAKKLQDIAEKYNYKHIKLINVITRNFDETIA